MVLARWATKVATRAVVGDTVPDPAQVAIEARMKIRRWRATRGVETPRQVFKRVVTERAAEQVEDLIRRTEGGERFINATRNALSGPRDGPGTVIRRTRTFLEEVRRE